MSRFGFDLDVNKSIFEVIEFYKRDKELWHELIEKNYKWAKNYIEPINYNKIEEYL